MRNAIERRFAGWVDVVGDVLLQNRTDLPVGVLLSEFQTSFGTHASWNWKDSGGSFGFQLHDPVTGWPNTQQLDFWAREAFELHPLVRWFATSHDPTAMTVARVPSRVYPRRGLQMLREQLAPVAMEQQLIIPYRMSATELRVFMLSKAGADFDDEDVALARRIQPLLTLLARQALILEEHARGASLRAHATAASLGLTGREFAVLQLLGDGKTAAGIGRQLCISPRTVNVHLDHLYRKLAVHDRLMAVHVARECGLLPAGAVARQQQNTQPPLRSDEVEAHADTSARRAFAYRREVGPVDGVAER